jgi:hypothetical protein
MYGWVGQIWKDSSEVFIVFTADRHLCFEGPHMRIQLCLVGKMHFHAVHFAAFQWRSAVKTTNTKATTIVKFKPKNVKIQKGFLLNLSKIVKFKDYFN